ncbi:MAG: hypothetical protein GY757_09240 [bacterium]|nr:hypothetical protein [bacterium]
MDKLTLYDILKWGIFVIFAIGTYAVVGLMLGEFVPWLYRKVWQLIQQRRNKWY